ncbi:MAG: tetratricopeptide repeat protein, partial [Desulfosudaceae bacterium]
GNRLSRPVSCFSFALNYYLGHHRVTGYHLVNLLIHLLSALFLYKIIVILMGLARTGLSNRDIVGVAALATLLWAAHPIQTQAVTYIVQRMTSLAALFYLIGLWAYLRDRLAFRERRPAAGFKWLPLAAAAFLAGVLAKENAALFPVGLLLVEVFFFNGASRLRKRPVLVIMVIVGLLLAPLLIARWLGFVGGLESFLSGYELRPFSLKQRLLTEPRVIFFYVSQLFYPDPGRFSLEHYFTLSDSLWAPPVTFAAVSGLAVLFLLSLGAGRRWPWLGFPILFYLTHHLVEGTLVPLEIAYEHRNYLPSVFVFLPVAILLARGIRFYQKRRPALGLLLALFTGGMVFFFGLSTHLRNMDWRSEKSLWTSAVRVAPEMIRPWHGLGRCYTRGQDRDIDQARNLFRRGLDKQPGNYIFERALLWREIGKTYQEQGQWARAGQAFGNSLAIYEARCKENPGLLDKSRVKGHLANNWYSLSRLAALSDPGQALQHIDRAISYQTGVQYDISRALYQNLAGDYQGGLRTLERVIEKHPRQWHSHFALGHMLTFAGHYDRGYWFYRRALSLVRSRSGLDQYRPLFLYLSENRRLAGQSAAARRYRRVYLRGATGNDILALVNRHTTPTLDLYPFVDTGLMLRQIREDLCRFGLSPP